MCSSDLISTGATSRYYLDLQGLGFCEPVALTCLAAGVHYLHLRGQVCVNIIRPLNEGVLNYLSRLGLFEMLGVENSYSFQKRDPTGRFVELRRLSAVEEVPDATTEICKVFHRKFSLSDETKRALDTMLTEVTENVFHHSYSPLGAYLCCQSYSDNLAVAIVDLGEGIKRRLSDTEALQKKIEERGGALQAAITRGVTSRPSLNAGFGLALTSELIHQNAGSLRIYSQRDCLDQTGINYAYSEKGQRWPGTVIFLKVRLQGSLNVEQVYDSWPQGDDESIDFL